VAAPVAGIPVVVAPALVVNHLPPARGTDKGWQRFCQPFSLETVRLKRRKIFPVSSSASREYDFPLSLP
jgi:hypothetical protein